MKAALTVGFGNYIVLVLCELSVQSVGLEAGVLVIHGTSLIVAVLCVVISEIIISRIFERNSFDTQSNTYKIIKRDKIEPGILVSLWWWPVTTLIFPAVLFRSTNIMLSWHQSAIPYGYLAAIYLTFRTLQVWRRYQAKN